ncbi:MAG: hypothetical protein LIR40_08020 [Bacteroidota bacterium]|nr:hypothetical protein [Bacteroidota bacterium]
MVFKIYYCDSSDTADAVERNFRKSGFRTTTYDQSGCVTFDIIPHEQDYTRTRIVINDSCGNEILNESFRFWRNYLVVFEDNTVITLRRNFPPGEHTARNREKLDTFINALREKIKPSNDIIIQDDDEIFVV